MGLPSRLSSYPTGAYELVGSPEFEDRTRQNSQYQDERREMFLGLENKVVPKSLRLTAGKNRTKIYSIDTPTNHDF